MSTYKIPVREIYIYGEVCQDTVADIAEKLFYLEGQKSSAAIKVYISTDGGDIYSAIGIYDLLTGSKRPITTIATGLVSSAGILILGATPLERRLITRNSTLMIHGMTDEYCPPMDMKDIEISYKETKRVNELYASLLTEILGQDAVSLLKRRIDLYYDAESAIEQGIVGGIWRE